jgi:hypothetical protein
MAISVDWHPTEPTIRHWRFAGAWSWTELRQELARSVPIAEALPGRMDAIMDFTDVNRMAPGWMAGLRGVAPKAARNLRMVVVVSRNPLILTALKLFTAVNPRPHVKLASAPTVEDGIQIIRADRATDTQPAVGV